MDERVKHLYGVPLEEFVSQRNALARTLRESSERQAAEEVRALRKPTVSAWALNQLARRQPGKVGRLLQAADRLGQSQGQAVRGAPDQAKLREAMSAYREALEDLSREAESILEVSGSNAPAHMAEVTASLQAAAVDEEARRQLREGTLTRPFTTPGLAGLAAGVVAVHDSKTSQGGPESVLQESRQGELASVGRAVKEARERQRRARQQLSSLAQTAEDLKRRAERARERAERLASEAEEAEREAWKAKQRAEEASEAMRRARMEFDEAERALEETERLASLADNDRAAR